MLNNVKNNKSSYLSQTGALNKYTCIIHHIFFSAIFAEKQKNNMDKDIDIISITINGESNFSLLRRNFSFTPSEARQVSEGKMAIRQSKNSLIFPGIPKYARDEWYKDRIKKFEETGVWEAPSNMYWMFKMQTVAYILANANPFSSIQVDYDKLASGIVYFFRVTYFGITTTHIEDLNYITNVVISEIREVKRIGYARYLKNVREKYRDMFVSKTRFRCVKKVRGERRCDTARKERTKSKVCAVAEFILQNLKKRKGVRKFMTKDGRFKINLLIKIKDLILSKFGDDLKFRRIRDYIREALLFLNIKKEQILEECAIYDMEEDYDEFFVRKLILKYRQWSYSVLGHVVNMVMPKNKDDMIIEMIC